MASGPYAGTFTERIQARIGPQTTALPMGPFPDGFDPGAQNPSQLVPVGQLLNLDASFAIASPAGTVTGTKTLAAVVPADSNHAGACREWSNEPVTGFGVVTGAYKDVRAFDIAFEATITTADGSLVDRGTTDLQARQGKASNQGGVIFDVDDLGESFDSSVTLPPPVLGKKVNVAAVSGRVLVAVPAKGAGRGAARVSQKGLKFTPLKNARQIPTGSFLNTRKGTVRLETAANTAGKRQSGDYSKGLFQVLQSRKKKAKGLTDLVLKGGNFTGCGRAKRAQAALSRRAIRRLRGSAKGRFRTRGRYSAATVRGTKWTVTDRCDGTLTKVTRGKVAVRDFRRKKTIVLNTGKSYLAKAPR
jgi:hypothetical protein